MRGKLYFTAIVAGAAALAGLFVLVAAVTTFSGKAAAAGDGDIVLLVNNAYRQARRLTSASRTHCDTPDEAQINAGQTKDLFDWALDECTQVGFFCEATAILPPGDYTISGDFESADGNTTAHVERVVTILAPQPLDWSDVNCNGSITAVTRCSSPATSSALRTPAPARARSSRQGSRG